MKRILNAGCADDTYGTDFVDILPKRKEVKKVDLSHDSLPYKDNTFDEVYSRLVLSLLINQEHFLKEVHRVLKPGGKVYLIADNAGFYGFFNSRYFRNPGKKEKGKYKQRIYNMHTAIQLKTLLEDTGFKNIDVEYWVDKPRVQKTSFIIHYYMFIALGAIKDQWKQNIRAIAYK